MMEDMVCSEKRKVFDLAIVGGGPAGISAAAEAARNYLDTVLIEKKSLGGCIKLARRVDNFPPLTSASGRFLAELFEKKFEETKLPLVTGEVISLSLTRKRYFELKLKGKGKIQARAVILATGQDFFLPEEIKFLKKLSSFPGDLNPQDIDKDEKVAVVGGGEVALDQALYYADSGAEVTILARSTLRANPVLVREVYGRGLTRFLNVRLISGRRLKDGLVRLSWIGDGERSFSKDFNHVLIACGKKPVWPDIRQGRYERNRIHSGPERSFPGFYLAGDIKNGRMRYLTLAIADGLSAARQAVQYLGDG